MARAGPSLLKQVVDLILRWRYALLIGVMLLALVSIRPATELEFDRRIQSMFPQDDPLLENYNEAVRLFGGQETGLIVYDDPNLLSAAGLEHLAAFTDDVRDIVGVASATSMADMPRLSSPLSGGSLASQFAASADDPEALEELREELLGSDLLRGTLLGRDGRTAAILFEFVETAQAAVPREETIEALRQRTVQHEAETGLQTVLVGEPILIHDAFTYLEEDGVRLGVASSLILTIIVAVLFRNVRWMLLPLAVVHVSQFVTKAVLYWAGAEMTMVSSPMVALITVIAVATVVHVTVRFREQRFQAGPLAAMRRTGITIGPAIFWTCATTAAGFGSLVISSVTPVRSFGLMMALGSMVVFFAAVCLLPGGALLGRLVRLRNRDASGAGQEKGDAVAAGVSSRRPAAMSDGGSSTPEDGDDDELDPLGPNPLQGSRWRDFVGRYLLNDPQRPPAEGRMAVGLSGIVRAVERRPWRIALATALVLGFAALGFFRIEVATEFTENYREGTPIVEAYEFVSDRFGAVGSFDVLIAAPEEIDAQFLGRLQSVEQGIEEQPFVAKTLSLADLIDAFPPALQPLLINVVNDPEAMRSLSPQLAEIVQGFWNAGEGVLRIVVQVAGGQQAAQKRETIEAVETLAGDGFDQVCVAGVYILMTYLVESLLADQWTTFALAVGALFVMMAAAFRSWQLGFAALVPNVTPILIVVGLMGWVGLKLNVATAMISSVSMGMSIDFSIHYLYRFRRQREAGAGFYDALSEAHQSVGLSMVLANIALIGGFLALVISTFIPTVHFGILVSVAMLGGLAGNLVILPLLLAVLPAARGRRSREAGPPTASP